MPDNGMRRTQNTDANKVMIAKPHTLWNAPLDQSYRLPVLSLTGSASYEKRYIETRNKQCAQVHARRCADVVDLVGCQQLVKNWQLPVRR